MIGLILFIVALVIFAIAFPIALIYLALDTITKTLFKIAIVIDMGGNVLCAELFNDYLIKKKGYKFGNRKETISSVLGKNQIMNTLKPAGKLLADLLDKIDKRHCYKSIDFEI